MGGSGAIGGNFPGQGGAVGIVFGGKSGTCDSKTSTDCIDVAPSCGDGKINVDGEECDDGNPLPGDGCSGRCKREKNFMCPTPGQPCVSTIVCGDGMLGPGEGCDDGNTMAGDGCAANCRTVEPGFVCRSPGKACTRAYLCGDGLVDPNEGCDDKNTKDGDGCDSRCRIELGFKCDGMPSTCTATKCGDGKQEGAESCDDGNKVPFDGCSADCKAEPTCATGGSCTSKCGDGIVLNEECDDGNSRDGDGCSSQCKIETAFMCTRDTSCTMQSGKCTLHVPAIFRDFKPRAATGGHPDFEVAGKNRSTLTGLVDANLDADGKPVYNPKSTNAAKALITSQDTFKQWYRTTANVNKELSGEIVLWDNGKGGYVNRFGPNGEQFKGYPAQFVNDMNMDEIPGVNVTGASDAWCANGPPNGLACDDPACAVTDPLTQECQFPYNNGGGDQNQAFLRTIQYFDGNPLFFPVDSLTPNEPSSFGQVSPAYAWNWVYEDKIPQVTSPHTHNFSFTTEVKYWFQYDAKATPARLDFTGDDDVWVFINGHLAVDIGGYHIPQNGGVTVDAAHATTFGLQDGKVYPIAIFQAERETVASSFRLTLAGFNAAPSDCHTDCGDGQVAAGEACDDGTDKNTGEYNACTPNCQLGPRCGDAVVQKEYGEACDEGTAANTGAFGGCAANCQIGPYCGDSAVDPDNEECDDGMNVGDYGGCAPGCKIGPHCGDGKLQAEYEECDDGNTINGDGCSAGCKPEIPR